MEIRLQKWLAMAGVASRRKAEELIREGRVRVNGNIVTELGAKACPQSDMVELDGKIVEIESDKVYIMLHKPEGVVTTVTDPFGRSTVMDFVPQDTRLFPVGRLDQDTSGIILLTNDGEWAQKLTHPKHETKKTYVAVVKGTPTAESLTTLRKGISIDGKKTAPAQVRFMGKQKSNTNAILEITIHEGRNRQVRKMCEAIGHRILNLQRVKVGNLELGDLPKGKWRVLTRKEVNTCV